MKLRILWDFGLRPSPLFKLGMAAAFAAAIAALQLTPVEASGVAQTTKAKSTASESQKNLALGLDHFLAHCAACHGEMGKADTEKGKSLGAADLTSEEVQGKSDADLFKIISKGVAGTSMPAFGKTHSATEIRHIILFLRKLPTLTEEEKKELQEAIPPSARHKHGGAKEHDHHHETNEEATHRHSEGTAKRGDGDRPGTADHQAAGSHSAHQHVDQELPPLANRVPAPSATGEEAANGQHHQSHGSKPAGDHSGHDMKSHEMAGTVTGGPYRSMHSIGSGTSLLPASSPGNMWHWVANDWMIMAHGDLKVGFNHQGGPRGINKAESENWFMLMAEHPTSGGGRLMLRGMFSGEPATAPRRGFPELLQTGETYKGRPIIDAQHPHDLFMELAASFTMPVSEHVSVSVYGGPVGEPALGPPAFMHRASASENPAAPLGHHWQDSTHIAHGVVTGGLTAWKFKVEGSYFRGAEPDEDRTGIELGKLDSWSGRIWFAPTPDWAFQFSHGHLKHPELLEPGDLDRTTASISHNRAWADGNWATSLIWGRNSEQHGDSNSYLLESTANFLDKNYLYTRLELVDKRGLLDQNIFGREGFGHRVVQGPATNPSDASETHRVGAFTFGAVRDLVATSSLRVGVGGDATFYHLPGELKTIYGSSPTSFHLFIRLRPGKTGH